MTVSRSSATVTERIKEAVETALKACADGRAPAILAAAFNDESDRYNASRSPLNQLIAGANGTEDARTLGQWKDAGRHVKAGSKAFYIFAPAPGGADTGYRDFIRPVFGVEDTYAIEGDQSAGLPELKTRSRDLDFASKIKGRELLNDTVQPDSELLHAICSHAQRTQKTKVPSTYDDLTNMTADLAAAVLSEMSGIPHKSQGYSYQNIRTYIKISKREPLSALRAVLADVKEIVNRVAPVIKENSLRKQFEPVANCDNLQSTKSEPAPTKAKCCAL